jgi:hypothetical protein
MKIELKVELKDFIAAQFIIVTSLLFVALLCYIFSHVTGHGNVLGFLRLFNVSREQSIPTYFSTFNLLLSSLLILILSKSQHSSSGKVSRHWLLFAAVFLYLSIDEGASIHENFAQVQDYLENHGLLPHILEVNKWLPIGVVLALVVGFIFLPLVRSLPRDTMMYFMIAGVIYFIGVFGFEFVGTLMLQTGFVESKSDLIYSFRRILEEGFEMYGIALFNCILYREILKRNISITLNDTY